MLVFMNRSPEQRLARLIRHSRTGYRHVRGDPPADLLADPLGERFARLAQQLGHQPHRPPGGRGVEGLVDPQDVQRVGRRNGAAADQADLLEPARPQQPSQDRPGRLGQGHPAQRPGRQGLQDSPLLRLELLGRPAGLLDCEEQVQAGRVGARHPGTRTWHLPAGAPLLLICESCWWEGCLAPSGGWFATGVV